MVADPHLRRSPGLVKDFVSRWEFLRRDGAKWVSRFFLTKGFKSSWTRGGQCGNVFCSQTAGIRKNENVEWKYMYTVARREDIFVWTSIPSTMSATSVSSKSGTLHPCILTSSWTLLLEYQHLHGNQISIVNDCMNAMQSSFHFVGFAREKEANWSKGPTPSAPEEDHAKPEDVQAVPGPSVLEWDKPRETGQCPSPYIDLWAMFPGTRLVACFVCQDTNTIHPAILTRLVFYMEACDSGSNGPGLGFFRKRAKDVHEPWAFFVHGLDVCIQLEESIPINDHFSECSILKLEPSHLKIPCTDF